MNKILKFKPHFIDHVKSKPCGITARMFDEKHLSEGEVIDLLDSASGRKFATAKITKVVYKSFSEMAKDAADPEGLYAQYKSYYHHKIEPDMQVKIIHFDVIER